MIPDPVDQVVASGLTGLAAAYSLYLLASFTIHMIKECIMPKTYGPDTVPEVPKIEFDLRAIHENPETSEKTIKTHHFTAAPDPGAGDFHRFALASQKGGGDLLIVLGDIMPRMIVNDDGVPAQWKYKELPAKVVRNELPTASPTELQRTGEGALVLGTMDDGDPVPHFRGPDGQIYPEPDRKRFEEFEAGSSRRRLYNLMFEDVNVKVHMQTVAEIMKDLFEAAGKGRGSD
jgi:hypothetical protein